MRIDCHEFAQLSPAIKKEIFDRADREFGHVPIVREHVWSEPRWSMLGIVNDEIVSMLNIVDRHASADGAAVQLFGLNNVITEPQHRKQGYSAILNRNFLQFIADRNPDGYGLLFCADDLISFYSRFGWTRFDGAVIVHQPSGEKTWPSNAMYYSRTGPRLWKSINLCGLPW